MDDNERKVRDTKIDVLNMYMDKVNALMVGVEESDDMYAQLNTRKQQIQQEIDNLRALV